MKYFFLVAVLIFGVSSSVLSREWTSTDGKNLKADFVSSADGKVILKRARDGKQFTLALDRLSEADRKWVGKELKKVTPLTGPFAKQLSGDWVLAEHDGLPYAIFGAADLDGNKKYPLLISLHGRSSNEENGKQVNWWTKLYSAKDFYKKHPSIIIAPLGYQPFGGEGRAWTSEPGEKTLQLIEELRDSLPVDKDRIYVLGHSMGGFGTCHFIDSKPKLFAAGIASAGCTSPSTAGAFKRFPLRLFHAADDRTVDVKYSRDLAEALKRSKTFKYTEYPEGGHNIVGKIIKDPEVHEWLFQQSRK